MNTFELVRCSKNDVQVRSMFDKMVFNPSLVTLRPIFALFGFLYALFANPLTTNSNLRNIEEAFHFKWKIKI